MIVKKGSDEKKVLEFTEKEAETILHVTGGKPGGVYNVAPNEMVLVFAKHKGFEFLVVGFDEKDERAVRDTAVRLVIACSRFENAWYAFKACSSAIVMEKVAVSV